MDKVSLFETSDNQPGVLRSGDVNGDGYVDLLLTANLEVANTNGTSYIFLNNE